MRYLISVCTTTQETGFTKAIAVAWHNRILTQENEARLTSEVIEKYTLVKAITEHQDAETALNAALSRVAEKLFLRGLVPNPVNGAPPFRVIAPPKHSKAKLQYPHETQKTHVTLKGALRLLKGCTNG